MSNTDMCGIFGHVGYLAPQRVQLCTDKLAHRGPDGGGTWNTAEVSFGHRRLSILDLSELARQPMRSESGRYWITFNGELYNFLEIRDELAARGHSFKSTSDTEVILAAFEEWGEDCQKRFNGMWAFAIWDVRENTLFLSRDRFGKKPLYYSFLAGQNFAFASEMKALFPLLDGVRANASLVRDTARIFTYESSEECVIEGIKRFPAGHSGWLKNGQLTLRRWWCTLDHLPKISEKYDDQVEQFRELFLDACRLRMRSDVPLGTALSGGLDSSATISCMAHIATHENNSRMGKSWQHAFVASFPGTPLDETEYARVAARHIGIDPMVIEVDPLVGLSKLNEYFYLFEDLYITSPIPFMQTYDAIKQSGVSVTLDGHGADELFGGYSFDYVRALQDAGWNLPQAFNILEAYYSTYGPTAQVGKFLPKPIYLGLWHLKRLSKKLLAVKQSDKAMDSSHANWQYLDQLNRQLYASTHETVLPTLLRNYDRYSMANGVEIRMPFMDHRIVAFAFALPWKSKLRGGYSKAIVRDALAQYMPVEIAYRKTKIGFGSPIVNWMQGPLKEYLLDILSSRSFKECDLIDPVVVANKIRRVMNDPRAQYIDGEQAWTMLSPYLWECAVIKRAQAG